MIYKFCEQLRNTTNGYNILLEYCDYGTDNKVSLISNWNTIKQGDYYTSRYYYVENNILIFSSSVLMSNYIKNVNLILMD